MSADEPKEAISDEDEPKFKVGDIVWGVTEGEPAWPAEIVSFFMLSTNSFSKYIYEVTFINDRSRAHLEESMMYDFELNLQRFSRQSRKQAFKKAVQLARMKIEKGKAAEYFPTPPKRRREPSAIKKKEPFQGTTEDVMEGGRKKQKIGNHLESSLLKVPSEMKQVAQPKRIASPKCNPPIRETMRQANLNKSSFCSNGQVGKEGQPQNKASRKAIGVSRGTELHETNKSKQKTKGNHQLSREGAMLETPNATLNELLRVLGNARSQPGESMIGLPEMHQEDELPDWADDVPPTSEVEAPKGKYEPQAEKSLLNGLCNNINRLKRVSSVVESSQRPSSEKDQLERLSKDIVLVGAKMAITETIQNIEGIGKALEGDQEYQDSYQPILSDVLEQMRNLGTRLAKRLSTSAGATEPVIKVEEEED